jgi:Nucleotidyltransferase of unknown function (DUF6036)
MQPAKRDRKPVDEPHQPWRSFLRDLDKQLVDDCELRCFGGFVVTQLLTSHQQIESIAGVNSALHRKYRVYLQHVTVTSYPEEYAKRLVRMFPNASWQHLRLFALEAHDLALSKLERNNSRDREDIRGLANSGHLDPTTLKERYQDELRPNLIANEESRDLTLKLWLEMCWPSTASQS